MRRGFVGTYKDKYYNVWEICRNMLEHARMYGNMWAQNENLFQYVRTGQGNMWGISWNALEYLEFWRMCGTIFGYAEIYWNMQDHWNVQECVGLCGNVYQYVIIYQSLNECVGHCGNVAMLTSLFPSMFNSLIDAMSGFRSWSMSISSLVRGRTLHVYVAHTVHRAECGCSTYQSLCIL